MEANRVELTMTQIKWACENENDWEDWIKKSPDIPEDKLGDMEFLHTCRDYLVELITWIERGIGMHGENDNEGLDKLLEEARQKKICLQEEMEAMMAEQGGEVRNVEERDGEAWSEELEEGVGMINNGPKKKEKEQLGVEEEEGEVVNGPVSKKQRLTDVDERREEEQTLQIESGNEVELGGGRQLRVEEDYSGGDRLMEMDECRGEEETLQFESWNEDEFGRGRRLGAGEEDDFKGGRYKDLLKDWEDPDNETKMEGEGEGQEDYDEGNEDLG